VYVHVCQQIAKQSHGVKIGNKLFENLAEFLTLLGMTLTVHNYMHEEIKSRLILGTIHCHLVKN